MAEVNTVQVEKTITVEEYQLTLTKEEFLTLRALIGKSPYSPIADHIWKKMGELGL